MPVAIDDDWNLITRPVIPPFVSQAHPRVRDPRDPDRSTAFGDITLMNPISPSPAACASVWNELGNQQDANDVEGNPSRGGRSGERVRGGQRTTIVVMCQRGASTCSAANP